MWKTATTARADFRFRRLLMRLAAAVSNGDWNILLTSYLTPESRMMIRRNVRRRLDTLADFLSWDADPYLVLTADGRLVWIVDGYMTSRVHPYSREIGLEGIGTFNYIRNSVKATVDAYNGTVHLYVFDPDDPLLQAYRNLFPALFEPASAMPAESARARPLSRNDFRRAVGNLPAVPHARSGYVLQQVRRLGHRQIHGRAEWRTRAGGSHLRGGHFARRDEA